MTDQPNPVRIAAAIAELGTAKVCDAWHYIEAHERLGAREPCSPVGIPPLELRHALERPRADTEAMRALDHWRAAGERGQLSIAGKVGRGKSHAAACWALDRAREFKSTLWIACANWPASSERTEERELLVRRALYASALVIDDLGAGKSSAPWVHEHFEPILTGRQGRFAPTVILTNMDTTALTAWMGGRVDDRLAYAGGTIELEEEGESLRSRDDTPLDERGRSPMWHDCARLVDLVGCEFVDDRLVVGGKLDAAARYGNRANVEAAKLLGLNRDAVLKLAREQEQRDAELVGRFDLDVDVSEGLTWRAVGPALRLRIVKNGETEAEAARLRADALARAKLELQPVELDLDAHVNPAKLAAAKQVAAAWRMRIVDMGADSWRVLRCDGAVLADGLPTDALAYYHAALVVRRYQAAANAKAVPA